MSQDTRPLAPSREGGTYHATEPGDSQGQHQTVKPLDEVLSEIGVGRFHVWLFCLCSFGVLGDAMEKTAIGFLYQISRDRWHTPDGTLGLLGAASGLGLALGASIWGCTSDYFGLRPGFIWCLMLSGIVGIACAAVPTYGWLVLLRTIISFGIGGAVVIDFTLLSEFLPKEERAKVLSLLYIFFGAGRVLMSVTAWVLLPSWRYFLVVLALPSLVSALLRWGTPETPKYLVQRGDVNGALDVLKKIATCNRTTMPCAELEPVIEHSSLGTSPCTVHNMHLWAIWLLLAFSSEWTLWMPTILDRLGFQHRYAWLLVFNMNELVAPVIVSITGLAAAEVAERRKRLFWTSFVAACAVTAVSCALKFGLPDTLVGILSAVASYLVMMVWVLMYAWTPEMYPTHLRTTGFGTAMAVNRLGAVVSPLFASQVLARMGVGAPAAFSGVSCFVLALISLRFEEHSK